MELFHETILAALFAIHVNLHAMEFPLIFGETNFVGVLKICEIHEIYSPQKERPMVTYHMCNTFGS